MTAAVLERRRPPAHVRRKRLLTAVANHAFLIAFAIAFLAPFAFILLTSPAGVEGSADRATYGAVKAGQRGFAKSLAREWGPIGIRVNCIGPVAMTPAMERAYAANPNLESRLNARIPLGRVGDPEADIGAAAVFLASEMSRYITGQTFIVDGGGFLGL